MQHDEPREDGATAEDWAVERLIKVFDDQVEYLFASLRRLGAPPTEIEDLAHEVFVKFIQMKPVAGRRPAARLRLFGLAVRVMAQHRRRSIGASMNSPASLPLTLAALDRLPLKCRAVLVLRELDQVPSAEIAASLSMTRVGVAVRLRQARRQMDAAIRQLAADWQAGRFGRPDRLFAALGMDDVGEGRETVDQIVDLQDDIFLFEMVMDEFPDTVYFKDRQSRFTRINRYAAAHYGIGNPALAVGRTDFDFFTDEHAVQALRDEQQIIRTGQPLVSIEEQETLPDGKLRRVWTTKLPLHDRGGQIVGTFGLSRDIAERTAG